MSSPSASARMPAAGCRCTPKMASSSAIWATRTNRRSADWSLTPSSGQSGPSGVDERLMTQVSELTGGRYFRAVDPAGLQSTYDAIAQMEQTRVTSETLHSTSIDWLFAAAGLALLGLEAALATTILRSAP